MVEDVAEEEEEEVRRCEKQGRAQLSKIARSLHRLDPQDVKDVDKRLKGAINL